jgi:putative spermidine/putrescine transport system permease protein
VTSRGPILVYVLAGGVATFLIAPLVIVMIMSLSAGSTLSFPPAGISLRWYENLARSPLWSGAILTSLQVGALAALLATVLGTLAAIGLVRGRYPGGGLLNGLVLSPLIVPIVVTAIGMYLVFVDWGLTGTFVGLVIAHTVLGLPFVVIIVSASLQLMDPNLELAAQSLGANPVRAFFRVTLPLISPGVATGALLAFIWSWDELVVAIFLSSPLTRTLPVVMWGQIRSRIDPTIAAVATLFLLITIVVLVLVVVLRRQAQHRTATGGQR